MAAIQHSIVLPTNAPIYEQKSKIFTKVKEMIDKAAELGANIICLPETWSKKKFFPLHKIIQKENN